MSILINGMSLPKDGCRSCGFDIYGSCLIKANMDKPYEVTHNCPLIELPPHGRLGDLDALYEVVKNRTRNWAGGWSDIECVITGNDIKNAYTIIPADPKEGGVDG